MKENQLSDAEKKLFLGLENEETPAENLEKKIVERLYKKGYIRQTKIMNGYLKWVASIAASILFFIAGIFYEKLNTNTMVEIEPTKGYMLLLHEDQNFSPGDPMSMYEEYKLWMENSYSSGLKITGQELKEEATLIGQAASSNDSQKRTTGYFLLEANSLEEAVKVAEENPHVKYGGTIEVKSFMVR